MRKITSIVIMFSIAALVSYDVYVYFKTDDDTISVVMWLWSQGNPVWQFLFGFLMGHWFAPPYPREEIDDFSKIKS